MSDQLQIDKSKVLEAAEKCSTAKDIFKTLWPEIFENDDPFSHLRNLTTGGWLDASMCNYKDWENKANFCLDTHNGKFCLRFNNSDYDYELCDNIYLVPTKKVGLPDLPF